MGGFFIVNNVSILLLNSLTLIFGECIFNSIVFLFKQFLVNEKKPQKRLTTEVDDFNLNVTGD